MKRIILFRHAKSDWPVGVADHERGLSKRGQRDAQIMGRALAAADQVPDYILCSSAQRAIDTLGLAIQAGGWECARLVTDALYDARPDAIIDELQQLPQGVSSVMLVGHEPTWSQLTSRLIGGGNITLKTATMACVGFEVDSWQKVDMGMLLWLIQPKFLTGSF